MKKISLLSLILFFIFTYAYSDLDASIEELASKMSSCIKDGNIKNIGILEFAANDPKGEILGGNTGVLGKYVAEKMEEYLVKNSNGKYSIIERNMVKKVIDEIHFQLTDLVNQSKLISLQGKITGLDTMLTGSMTRMGEQLKINSKFLSIPSAKNRGADSVSVALDSDLLAMFGETTFSKISGESELKDNKNIADKVKQEDVPYSIEIVVNDSVKPFYLHDGNIWIPAKTGEEYSIRIHNKSDKRVAVALFIDGINTIGGKRELPSKGRKWVVRPRTPIEIKGWQKDDKSANKFVFCTSEQSLAQRLNYSDEIGLITASFYKELSTRGVIGTGEGKKIDSNVTEVTLNYEEKPSAIICIKYDTEEIVKKYRLKE